MGIGTKFKEVFTGDRERRHDSVAVRKAPGAYPSEDGNTLKKSVYASTSRSNGHKHQDSAVDFGGSQSKDSQSKDSKSKDRADGAEAIDAHRQGGSGTNGRDPYWGSVHHGSEADFGADADKDSFWANPHPANDDVSEMTGKDLQETPRPTAAADYHAVSKDNGHQHGDPVTNGGVYNTVTGHGSQDDEEPWQTRPSETRQLPVSAGSTKVAKHTVSAAGRRSQDKRHHQIEPNGDSPRPSREDGDVGAENGYRRPYGADAGDYAYSPNGAAAVGSVAPRGAMDPYYSQSPPLAATNGAGNANMNTAQPMVRSSSSAYAKPASSTSSGAAPGFGMGPSHYGPGHEGAKVMHRCQHCGGDNDISRYFKKETVYRID